MHVSSRLRRRSLREVSVTERRKPIARTTLLAVGSHKPMARNAACCSCTIGYYGDPMIPGDYCKPCDCHGNADEKRCDTVTGQCYDCQHNTHGLFCDVCAEGFFGSARNGDCRRKCLEHSHRRLLMKRALRSKKQTSCESARNRHGAVMCLFAACECNMYGTEPGSTCSQQTGQCLCRPRFTGRDCGQCIVRG